MQAKVKSDPIRRSNIKQAYPPAGPDNQQIESKTGLEKTTIGRIKKEVDGDKENSKGGCLPKLSSGDKQSIIC